MEQLLLPVLTHPHAIMFMKAVLTSFFWLAGLFGVFNFRAVVQEMIDAGLPRPALFAAATILCQLGGATLLITDIGDLAWLGAGALGVFTLLCIPIGHPFWKFDGQKAMHEFQIALEHVAVVGGLMIAAAVSMIY
ncbi:DoxX family protein [Mangrovicoccus ximenensis]|uniref:DoxX family protein n=1 Tax=Mangrovicoccus ximenensis TaxID=1911570 RepID=UPI000D3BC4C0|nr:DoxX family protein [Mangrovicoccus ximenensis]